MEFLNRKQRFSIRKFNVGVASVLLGTVLVGFGSTAMADEVDNNEPLVVLEESPPVVESELVIEQVTSFDNVVGSQIVNEVVVTEVIVEKSPSEILEVTEDIESTATEHVTVVKEMVSNPVSAEDIVAPEEKTEAVIEQPTTSNPVRARVSTRQATSNKPVVRGRFRPTTQTVQPVPEAKNTVSEPNAIGGSSVVTDSEKVQEVSDTEKFIEVLVDDKDMSTSTKVDGLTEVEEVNGLGGMTVSEEAFYAQYTTRSASSRSSNLIGDDYPWKYHNVNIWEADPWGAYKRQCTSFVAYRLSSVNKFEIPRAYGNAGTWGTRAANEGYRVDMTPAKGAVAWFGPSAFGGDSTYGHVAWVADIKGDMVVIEEYNVDKNPYGYFTREIPKNHVSGYIHFKDLTGTAAQSTAISTLPTNAATTIPNSGRYTFTSRVGVKSEAKISSPDLAYYNAGNYVNYDSVLQADGYQWISYVSYLGGRSYIPIAKLTTQTSPTTTTPTTPTNSATNLPSSGRYTFTSRVGVKSEAKISSPDLAYYNAGNYVNYDSVLQADGYQWISYKNYNGGRSYIPVAKLTNQTTPAASTPTVAKPTIPSQGTYTFTKRTSVQAEAKVSSPELAYYNAGSRVRYDRVLVSDGHQWISYIAASGNRRYARID